MKINDRWFILLEVLRKQNVVFLKTIFNIISALILTVAVHSYATAAPNLTINPNLVSPNIPTDVVLSYDTSSDPRITGVQFDIAYNDTLLRLQSGQSPVLINAVSSHLLNWTSLSAGVIRIVVTPLNNDNNNTLTQGTLLRLPLSIVSPSTPGIFTTTISFVTNSVKLGDFDANTINIGTLVSGNVTWGSNIPPTANAGVDQSVTEGSSVTLNGGGSTDSDGSIVSYAWAQTSGPAVTLNNANTAIATFIAPQVSANTALTFNLTVRDNNNTTAVDAVTITVSDVLTVATPVISPNGGSILATQTITLATSTAGAAIRYTTDGTTPTASSTLYSSPFTLASSAAVRAIGILSGYTNSAVASASFTVNRLPVFSTTPVTGATVGVAYTYDVNATDADGHSTTFSLTQFPTGMTINTSTGVISWTPASGQVGSNSVTVKVTDSGTPAATADQIFTITVAAGGGSGPVAYWRLDESSGATTAIDSSGNGRNGQVLFGASFVTGHVGSGALSFDGVNDYVSITGYKGITGTASRTVAAWIKTTTSGAILSWGAQVLTEKWTFRVQQDNGSAGAIRVEVQGGYIVGTTDLRDNQWHHVAAVLIDDGSPNATEILLYIDGILESTSASAAQPINTTGSADVRIGTDFYDRYFSGLIDDVRIYDRALNSTEVANLVDSQPLVATPMINPTGGTYTDSVTVTMSTTTTGALIYYTTDGTTPSASATQYGGAFTLTNSATVQAIGLLGGYNDSAVASTSYIITTNTAPAINSTPVTAATAGVAYSYDVNATDAEGNTLTYSLIQFPTGMTIDSGTGLVNWIPTSGQVGSNSVTVRVTDSGTPVATAEQPFTITVAAAGGTVPNLLINPGFETGSRSPWAGSNSGSIETTNVHSGTYAWKVPGNTTGNPYVDQTVSVIAGKQYRVSGWISFKNETAGDDVGMLIRWYNSSGTEITPRVYLSGQLSSNSDYVQQTADVTAPTGAATARIRLQVNLTNGIGYLDDASFAELGGGGTPVVSTPTITPNGGAMLATQTITLATSTSGAAIRYTTDGTTPTSSSTLYSSPFTLASSATVRAIGILSGYTNSAVASASFTVNRLPVFSTTPVTAATVGVAYSYDVNATDADGHTTTFSLTQFPTGMTINSSTGIISWTPTSGQEGSHSVNVRVTDNGSPVATTDQPFTIIVASAGGGGTGPNLIVNPGFETGSKSPWGGSGTIVTSPVHGGTYAVKIQGVSTNYYSIIQNVPVTVGEQYRVSGWISLSGKTTGNIFIQVWWYKSDGTEVSTSSRITIGSNLSSNSGYVERTADITPPTGAVTARIRMQTNKTDGIAYLDDVSFAQIN